MAAELGSTTNPKDLIPGEPEAISNDLRGLVANIQKLAPISQGLGNIDPFGWVGKASDSFRDIFRQEPPKWEAAIETAGQSGQALADYADTLTWGQKEAQRAIEMYLQAEAASRSAQANYDAMVAAGATPIMPFQDPGTGAANEAQAVLDNARKIVQAAGGEVAIALGFEPDGEGGFKKKGGEREWGAGTDRPEGKEGWHKGKGGKSYEKGVGSQSDGLLTDLIGDTLKSLGIELPEASWEGKAEVEWLKGELGGEFDGGWVTGSGKLEGSLLGAGAEASASIGPLGMTAAASAEAYLAKGHAEGELGFGDHGKVSGSADAMIGAEAKADATVGWLGAQGSAEAFAGARVEGEASAEVAGIGAGVHGEAWAGIGAEASGQFGMGDDGKFHVGASVGVAFGVGGKVGFDFTVDPGAVADTISDVADDVGEVAADVGRGVANAAESVGRGIGNAASAVGDFLGF